MKPLAICFVVLSLFIGNVTVTFAAKDNLASLGKVSTQKKFTMYLGTNDKDTLRQEIPTETMREQMHEICLKYTDGYTVSIMEGYYRNDAGDPMHEVTLVYVFFDTPLDAVKKIMDEALVKFNQASILLEESRAKSIFYNGKNQRRCK